MNNESLIHLEGIKKVSLLARLKHMLSTTSITTSAEESLWQCRSVRLGQIHYVVDSRPLRLTVRGRLHAQWQSCGETLELWFRVSLRDRSFVFQMVMQQRESLKVEVRRW